jgi:hypothetical protein
MRHTRFKIDDITFHLTPAQSLPTSWKNWTILRAPAGSSSVISARKKIVHEGLLRKVKDEYYCRIGRKVDEAHLGAQQTHLAVT